MNGASTLNLADFYKWWLSLRQGDEIVPQLKSFIPAELGYASDWAYCMQRDNNGIIRARYWGVALDAMSSQQILGEDYLAAHTEEDAALLAEHYDHICSIPCGGYVERTMLTIDGRELKFRHIDLPLASGDRCVDHLCGISDVMAEYAPSRTRLKDKIENKFGKFRYFDLSAGPKIAEWETEGKA